MKLCTSKHLGLDTWVHIFFGGLGKATRFYHFFSSCCEFVVNVIQSVEFRPPAQKLYGWDCDFSRTVESTMVNLLQQAFPEVGGQLKGLSH